MYVMVVILQRASLRIYQALRKTGVCLDLRRQSHSATLDAAHLTLQASPHWPSSDFLAFNNCQEGRRQETQPQASKRLFTQSYKWHHRRNVLVIMGSTSLILRDRTRDKQRHCGDGGRSVSVCVSLIIIAYSFSLTQHSAERAQSTAWVIPADPGSAFNPTLCCTEKGAVPHSSELRSAQSQQCLCSGRSNMSRVHLHTYGNVIIWWPSSGKPITTQEYSFWMSQTWGKVTFRTVLRPRKLLSLCVLCASVQFLQLESIGHFLFW